MHFVDTSEELLNPFQMKGWGIAHPLHEGLTLGHKGRTLLPWMNAVDHTLKASPIPFFYRYRVIGLAIEEES